MKGERVRSYAIARARLQLMLERLSTETDECSVSERALFTACEFWSAVETNSLRQLLGSTAAEQLRYLSIVYSAVGAPRISQILDETLAALNESSSDTWQVRCIATLHQRLSGISDPLLDLIARSTQSVH